MRLRGGGATSGIWETFNRMKAEGPHRLHEMKPQPFNELAIFAHRCNDEEGFHMAVSCQARPFKGERVEMVGVWLATPSAEVPAASREVTVELELDPTSTAEGRGASIWRAIAELPPGVLTYRYRIRRGGETEEETVSRRVEIYPKPMEHSVMVATDLDGTMLGDPKKIDTFFRVWNDEYKSNQSALVYNTGRPLDSALGLIERGELRQPTALICSEGTQIFWFGGDGDASPGDTSNGIKTNLTIAPDEEWRHNLNKTWDWPRLKEAVNNTLAPHRAHVTKFLPLADMDIKQPMVLPTSSPPCPASSPLIPACLRLSPLYRMVPTPYTLTPEA